MSDLRATFERCRQEKRAAFVPYLVAGNPDLRLSAELARAMVAAGADAVGLGVAFSDPIVDGPITQRAGSRALRAGGTLSAVLRLVAQNRSDLGVPVVLFTYCNPVVARGAKTFAEQASSSGVDAVVYLDLPPEEGEAELAPALRQVNVDTAYMLALSESKRRIKLVNAASSGFVLGIPESGVSSVRSRVPSYLLKQAKRVGRRLDLPLVAGLGVSTAEQVSQLGGVVDGVVVGSALALAIEQDLEAPDLVQRMEGRARELRSGLD